MDWWDYPSKRTKYLLLEKCTLSKMDGTEYLTDLCRSIFFFYDVFIYDFYGSLEASIKPNKLKSCGWNIFVSLNFYGLSIHKAAFVKLSTLICATYKPVHREILLNVQRLNETLIETAGSVRLKSSSIWREQNSIYALRFASWFHFR